MSLTIDRQVDETGVALKEVRNPFAGITRTGYGILDRVEPSIDFGTYDEPQIVYFGATQVYAGSNGRALLNESPNYLMRFLKTDWGSQDIQNWSDESVPYVAPRNLRRVAFQVRRVFAGRPSSAGVEEE